MKKLLALLVLLAAPAFAQINIGNGGTVNIGSGSGGGGIPYPGAGIACSTGSAWCSAYSAGNQIPSSYLNLSAYLTTTSAASTYQPISSMSGYALLAGANFTGALNGTSASFSGTVGIGTTSPGSKLTVKGGDAFVDGTATGVILRDTVVTTNCYRITIASGLVVPTLTTCPTD